MNFSNNLRYLRKQRGISQDALANKLGYKSFTTIQKWESGVSEPSVSTLKIIANIFGVSMDQMINEDLSDLSQPSSSAPELELTEQEERLVENFHRLSDSQQARLLAYLDGLLDAGRDVKGKDAGGSELTDLLYYDYKPASGMVAEPIAEYNCGRKTQAKKSAGEPVTIAAHHDSEDWTEEELAEIEKFKKYVKTERE